MGLAAKKDERFTYADYLTWEDNQRWEIINGEAFNMSPGAGTAHQLISGNLFLQLGNQLAGKTCEVITAPYDVRLPMGQKDEKKIIDVVQPDISVVCDPGKLDEKGCLGPPDVIIEILSASTYRRDRMAKFFLYEKAGVKEYWIVSPADKMVEVFILGKDGKYGRPEIYGETDTVHLQAVKGISVDLSRVFNLNIKKNGLPSAVNSQ